MVADIKFESINRVSSLPLVTSAVSIYDHAKQSKGMLGRSLGAAEYALRFAWDGASPLVHSFQGPLARVDSIACSGLDIIETQVPAIKGDPTVLYNSTRSYIEGHVQNGLAYGLNTLDAGLTVAESAVDRYLPAVEGEEAQKPIEAKGGVGLALHAVKVGEKVRNRLTHASMGRLDEAKGATRASIARLATSLEGLAGQAKAGMQRGSEVIGASERVPPAVLHMARALLDSMTKVSNLAQVALPAIYQTQIDSMLEYATNIYSHLSVAASSETALMGLKVAREQLAKLQALVDLSFLGSSPIARFLPTSLSAPVSRSNSTASSRASDSTRRVSDPIHEEDSDDA